MNRRFLVGLLILAALLGACNSTPQPQTNTTATWESSAWDASSWQ